MIRELRSDETELLKTFLYEAIFIPEGVEAPDPSIIEQPELKLYYEGFGEGKADHCLVAEEDGRVVGAVWTRIMKDYGHVDDDTPSFAIALFREYRGRGVGTRLMMRMLELLREKGYQQASLAVQKANYAVRMYKKVGFQTIDQNEEEYIMVCKLGKEGATSSKNMNALIIGGSGGLSSVVAKMAMEHYKVWTLTRGVHELPEGVTALRADRNDLPVLKQLLSGADVKWNVVFDCICMNREQAKADLEILPEFTDRLIVVSTDSVYDGRYKRVPEREDGICVNEPGDTKECSYAGNKRHMEEVFLEDMSSGRSGLKITIFRPGHIYGPGFLLGCFPEHSRQKELPELILQEKEIRLVGMGTYLIHPVYVDDLARALVDSAQKEKAFGEVFCIGGPEAIENKTYYEMIAECLGKDIRIVEIPLTGYLDKHPEYAGHLCHRVYDLTKLKNADVAMPSVGIREGIERSLRSLGYL